MGIANEILVGRFNRLAQKLFGMKGPSAVNQLSGEIGLTHDLISGNELAYLQGWDRFSLSPQVNAVAQAVHIRFRNPAGSNVIAVVESLLLNNTAASGQCSLGFGIAGANLASTTTGNRFDARGRTNPSIIASQDNTAPSLTAIRVYTLGVGANVEVIQDGGAEIPLLPGDALDVALPTALTSLVTVSAWFRERYLEESERS